MIGMQKVVDRELAIEQAGGNAQLASELFRMLLKELDSRMQTIQAAHERADRDTIRAEVHRINGAASYCGVPALKSVAHALDMRFKADDFSALEEGLEQLYHEIRRVLNLGDAPLQSESARH